MWPNPQETADLATLTEEILNEKLHFLCNVDSHESYGKSKINPMKIQSNYSYKRLLWINWTESFVSKVSIVTFTFIFSKIWISLNNYQFIQDIERKRCIIPNEIHYWKLLLRAHLQRIFIRHRLSLQTKWEMFLVPLWVVFVFEKIKNKVCRMAFFLEKIFYIERVVQL